jgi:DNA-binding response OmpR family regulator
MITAAGQELLNGDAVLVLDWLDKPVNFNKLLEAISRIKQINKSSLPHVLHVEDDDDTRHVVATLLEKEAKVTPSCTINETIHKLGQDRYDLVILDLALPDGKGSDLLPIFSKYKLPIIVYSAFDLDEECSKFVSQSLVKSKTSNEQLLKTIKELLIETNKDTEYAE